MLCIKNFNLNFYLFCFCFFFLIINHINYQSSFSFLFMFCCCCCSIYNIGILHVCMYIIKPWRRKPLVSNNDWQHMMKWTFFFCFFFLVNVTSNNRSNNNSQLRRINTYKCFVLWCVFFCFFQFQRYLVLFAFGFGKSPFKLTACSTPIKIVTQSQLLHS